MYVFCDKSTFLSKNCVRKPQWFFHEPNRSTFWLIWFINQRAYAIMFCPSCFAVIIVVGVIAVLHNPS